MVTQLIKEKEVRKKFNEVFKKESIENIPSPSLFGEYNAPLVGNALDYFISCHFNYLNKNIEDSFIENAIFWLTELKKTHTRDITFNKKVVFIRLKQRRINCHFNFINKNEFDHFNKKTQKWQNKIEKCYELITEEKGISRTQRTITFNLKFPKNIKKEFEDELAFWLDKLNKVYISETISGKKSIEKMVKEYTPEEVYYTCYKYNNGFLKYSFQYDLPDKFENLFGRELIYCYSAKEIAELIDKSLTKCKEYKTNGKLTEAFLRAIIILAQILPGIHLYALAKNVGNPSATDLIALKTLIKKIPANFFLSKNILINPSLSCGLIMGRPDYIIDDIIVDIKTTKDFFKRYDYNQLICYYLLYKIDEKAWNKAGIKINKIGIYYALYGQLIQFNVSDLCTPKDLKEIIKLIESKSHETSYY